MRLKGLIVAAALVASASAHAEWKEYPFADLGVRKDFPAEPKAEMGTYKSVIIGTLPAHTLSVTEPGSAYKLTVVDIPKDQYDTAGSLVGECNLNALLTGKKVISDTPEEIGTGKAGVWGRIAAVNLPDDTRSLTGCYSIGGRLYMVQSSVMAGNPRFPDSPDALRFVKALNFNMAGK